MSQSESGKRWHHRGAEWVPIDSLLPSDSPRLDGENDEHARALAAADADVPPILVHRGTMRVIDGMHRVSAAILRGADEILAIFYDGDTDDAFIVGVEANIAHGLPLSIADRTAAAARIIAIRPQWSDRKIASVCGLAATTVGAIRRRSTEEDGQSNTGARIGLDGRVRPLNTASGRMLASQLMRRRPEASVREIAAESGMSPATVLDVRRRLRDGEDPVPERHRTTQNVGLTETAPAAPRPKATSPQPPVVDRDSVLRNLRRDPSLYQSDAGRALLRWLDSHSAGLEDWKQHTAVVPAHCTHTLAELARLNSQVWQELAEHLERDARPRRQ